MSKKDFLVHELPQLLGKLTPETEGKFGIMTPQHMVEHLIVVMKITAKKHDGERDNPPTQSQAGFQKFVRSGCVIQHRPGNKTKTDLPPLKYTSLQEAVAAVPESVQRLYDLWEANPNYVPYSSFMGELSYEEVELFHYMHFRYHLWQFGLIEQYP